MDRRGHDALAVDAIGDASAFAPAAPDPGFDAIPMWVADMNFPVLPAIQASIIKRTEHPAFGYFETRDEYYDSIIKWHSIRNNVSGLARDAIGYENGVLGGVVSALGVTCSRGDSVLVHSPTYIGFTGTLKNNGYNIVLSPLEIDEGGVWRMNFEDMERKIRDNRIHAAIFCSPHNPCGRVWEKWELLEAYRLFEKYDVTVISDEIWSDIILNGHSHIPECERLCKDEHSRPVRSVQNFQSGRPHRQLPHHLRPASQRPRAQGIVAVPLQQHQRSVHARSDRRIF